MFFGVLCVVVLSLVSIALSLTGLFGGSIIWLIAMVAGLVVTEFLSVLSAKRLNRTMEVQIAKRYTSVACACYGLLVIPAVFLLRSIMIAGEGPIGDLWILFLIATLDAFVYVGVAGFLNRSAENADRRALNEDNAIA